jgi:hypothetical protein
MRTSGPAGIPQSRGVTRCRFVLAIERVFDAVVGPPRPRAHPDGRITVRLLGRRFEASNEGALFDAVAHEREKLLVQLGKMHEGAATRPFFSGSRLTDSYHFQTRRMEDRIALYTAFLGRMAREMGLE